MRTQRRFRLDHPMALSLRRVGVWVRETALWGAFIALIEVSGRHAVHDGADLCVVVGAGILLSLLTKAARTGWLPTTHALIRRASAAGRAALRAVAPGHAIAFRRTADVPAQPDRVLLWPIAFAGTTAILLLGLGPYVEPGALFVKQHVSYLLYLIVIAAAWCLQGVVTLAGVYLAGSWLQARGRGLLPAAVLVFSWCVGAVLIARLPGIVPIVALIGLAAWFARGLRNPLTHRTFCCRRDARGTALVLPVQTFVIRAYVFTIVGLLLAVAITAGPRLWQAAAPAQPFAFTQWLGLSTTLAAFVVAIPAGRHVRRIAGMPADSPDVPLTPTLWLAREDGSASDRSASWTRVVRYAGWWLARGDRPPDTGFDLVHGIADHARRFVPPDTTDEAEVRFHLERRLHVVMRRRFHRGLRTLFKRLRGARENPGTGFLFCPHIWLIPAVIRDAEPRRTARSPLPVPAFYGPPYAELFDLRLRRYLSGVLRTLEIDVIHWEDAIQWKDLRRVTGVLFECYDQGTSPPACARLRGHSPRAGDGAGGAGGDRAEGRSPPPGARPCPDPAHHARPRGGQRYAYGRSQRIVAPHTHDRLIADV